jgi:hypothetical protein
MRMANLTALGLLGVETENGDWHGHRAPMYQNGELFRDFKYLRRLAGVEAGANRALARHRDL